METGTLSRCTVTTETSGVWAAGAFFFSAPQPASARAASAAAVQDVLSEYMVQSFVLACLLLCSSVPKAPICVILNFVNVEVPMLLSFAVLLVFQCLGEGLVYVFGLPVP